MTATMENSKFKHEIFTLLLNWDYNSGRATVFNIARKAGCSESSAQKILRIMSAEGVAESSHGSWYLK